MHTNALKTFLERDMPLYIVILFFVEFVRGAALISFMPIYGEKELGMTLEVVGAAITAHFLTDTALKLSIGYLLDRLSVRTIIAAGLLCSLLGIGAMQYAELPWMFIAAAAMYGIGISPLWIVCLTKVKSNERGLQMGFLYTIWLVGMGSGPVVTNLLLDSFPAKITYYLMTAIMLLAFIGALFIRSERGIRVEIVPFRKQLAILGSRLKEMKLLLPGMLLQTLGAGMLMPILPSFASNDLGMTATHYSLLLLVGGLFTVLGLIPMGKLSDAWGKKWFLIIGFALFGIVLIILTTPQPIYIAMFWAAVLGLSYAAVLPAWNALLAAYVPQGQQGLGWGVLSTVEGVGGMIGPYIGGLLATIFTQSIVVMLVGILFILICLFYIVLPFRIFRGESKQA